MPHSGAFPSICHPLTMLHRGSAASALCLCRPPSYSATEAWLERRGRRKRKAAGAPTDVDWDMDPNTGKLLPVAAPGSYTQVRSPA